MTGENPRRDFICRSLVWESIISCEESRARIPWEACGHIIFVCLYFDDRNDGFGVSGNGDVFVSHRADLSGRHYDSPTALCGCCGDRLLVAPAFSVR